MLDISQHPALLEGCVTLDHSMPGTPEGRIDPSKVKYCLINPHSPSGDFAFPLAVERCLPQDRKLFEAYIRSENDSGVHALTQDFLDMNPGGVALTVEHPRGVLDANRVHASDAIRRVLSPRAPDEVTRILGEMHGHTLGVISSVLRSLPPDVKIFDLHSMEPFSTPKQPPLAHDNLHAFLAAYRDRELTDEYKRPVDLITGTEEGPPLADMEMTRAIERLLGQMQIPAVYNKPYATGPKYPDYHYMQDHPRRVTAVDLRKTDLCEGAGEDRSFDTTNPVVDEKRVVRIAEMLQEALRAVRVAI